MEGAPPLRSLQGWVPRPHKSEHLDSMQEKKTGHPPGKGARLSPAAIYERMPPRRKSSVTHRLRPLEMWGQPPRLSGGPEVSGRNFGVCRSLFEGSLLPIVGQTPKNCKPVVPTLAKNARMGRPLSW
jgi:hypothetical protein